MPPSYFPRTSLPDYLSPNAARVTMLFVSSPISLLKLTGEVSLHAHSLFSIRSVSSFRIEEKDLTRFIERSSVTQIRRSWRQYLPFENPMSVHP